MWSVGFSRISLLLAIALLAIVGLIQVLPQVDLPDTAFHEDETPAAARLSQEASPSSTDISADKESVREPKSTDRPRYLSQPLHQSNSPLPVLLSAFLC